MQLLLNKFKGFVSVTFIVILAMSFLITAGRSFARQEDCNSIADVVEKLSPAVVNISTSVDSKNKDSLPQEMLNRLEKDPFNDYNNSGKIISLGSGFIIDDNGHVVTNNHVVEYADEINITIGSDENKVYKAIVIGKDKKTDLALLKIDTKGADIPFVKFGDSDKARVGDQVIAIGNAFGFGGTVTTGIISAKGRYLEKSFYEDFIQTDASINRGNSGGPMFNMAGDVIGVNTIIVSMSGGNVGIGFAIPSNTVKQIVEHLLKDGKIERGWLGITFQPITKEIAHAFGLSDANGVIISNITKGSPAERAGFKDSDIIKVFNGTVIDNYHRFQKIVASAPLNKAISVKIIRDGKSMTLSVLLANTSQDPSTLIDPDKLKHIGTMYHGIGVVNITPEVRSYYGLNDSIIGILVTKVDKNSVAFENGVRVGDVISKINNHEVTSAKQFRGLLDNIKIEYVKKPKDAIAVFLISRNNSKFHVSINLR
jgi:serine protease Do